MDLLVTDTVEEEEQPEEQEDDQDEAIGSAKAGPSNEALRGDLRSRRLRKTSHTHYTDSPRWRLQEAWDNDAVAEQMDRELVPIEGATQGATSIPQSHLQLEKETKYNTGWVTQYLILTHRALKNSRSAIFTGLNLSKSVAIGAVAGLVWFQLDYTERDINDIRGYFFFTMTFWVFDAMFTALTAFPSEREVIVKERASGSYHLSAYFLAKTTSDAPVRLVLPLLYMIISHWMIGISNNMVVFVGTVGCTLLSVLAGEAIGLLIGAIWFDLQKAMTIMTVGTLFLMLLGGFFVENIPSFLVWAKYFSPFKYAFDSSLQLGLDRDVPCDGSGALEELCGGMSTGAAKREDVLDFVGVQGSVGFNVGLLLLACFIPRYWAYLALRMNKEGDRA